MFEATLVVLLLGIQLTLAMIYTQVKESYIATQIHRRKI